MSDRDPLELLRELEQARRAGEPTPFDVDAAVARVTRRLEQGSRAPRRRRRRWIVGALVALLGIGGGTVAWAITHRERASSPTMIACHQTDQTDGPLLVIDSDGTDPATQCAAAWPALRPQWGPVPDLTACKGLNGYAAVFPGDESTCARLGLANLDTTLTSQDQLLIAFEERLTTAVLDLGCMEPTELERLASTMLDDSGLEGWRVHVEGPFTPDQPCGSLQFDEPNRIVYVLPLPDMFSGPDGE